VIADPIVNREFGTGAVKITPGHDPNDFQTGRRHGLPMISVMDGEARMNAEAGPYAGLDRSKPATNPRRPRARGLARKVEPHQHAVGHCYRCQTVVEPMLSVQWFVKVGPLAEPAIQSRPRRPHPLRPRALGQGLLRLDGEPSRLVHLAPALVGHQSRLGMPRLRPSRDPGRPARRPVSPSTQARSCSEPIPSSARAATGVASSAQRRARHLVQLGAVAVLDHGWPERTATLERFYPTSVLVTGFDIIFFWVGPHDDDGPPLHADVPFRAVAVHALVRDERGQKMSKSKGNVIDPLELLDRFGTDALRFTLVALSAMGRDIKLSEDASRATGTSPTRSGTPPASC